MRHRLIILPMLLSTKTLGVSMTLWRCNGVRKFDTDAILFIEIQCKKRDILCLSDVSVPFMLESGNTHNPCEGCCSISR